MTNHPSTPNQDPSADYRGAEPPYGAPNYGTSKYGAPAYYQDPQGLTPQPGAVTGPQGLSLTSMIIGLASLIFVGGLMVPQIVGLVLGIFGIQRESPQGRGFALTGIITNSLALLIYAALWAFGLFFFAAIMGTMDSEFTSSV